MATSSVDPTVETAGRDDPGYPARLRALGAGAPDAVWWRGTLPSRKARAVAVVGSRAVTPDGARAARRAVDVAVDSGLVVVSGLSPGVDAVAHARCVERGGVGVAVVAGGPDVAEDDDLARLAAALVAGGGAVLAEHPPGTPITDAARAARCRLQAGLVDEVLVAQYDGAGDGTVHAIRAARARGIPVVAVTPPPGPDDNAPVTGIRT